ncbi:MAG TPA: Sec-independent protein translocase protein TatB [Stellaceae bacterium]|nr:Sec-independent protein translocase protein TatB [Stellaceae bacterium]
MFFDIGWPELMLIGVVALVVIGPKDLPRAMRIAGYWLRKARGLSRDFQNSVEQMIRESELDEMRQQLKQASEFDLDSEVHKTIDPSGELTASIKAPDYFEEAPPGAVAHAETAEPAEVQGELPLPEPAEAPAPGSAHAAEDHPSEPQPAAHEPVPAAPAAPQA